MTTTITFGINCPKCLFPRNFTMNTERFSTLSHQDSCADLRRHVAVPGSSSTPFKISVRIVVIAHDCYENLGWQASPPASTCFHVVFFCSKCMIFQTRQKGGVSRQPLFFLVYNRVWTKKGVGQEVWNKSGHSRNLRIWTSRHLEQLR